MKTETAVYFTIIQLRQNDVGLLRKLILLYRDVFEEHKLDAGDDAHLKALLAKPDFIATVAINDGEVVGGLTGYELMRYNKQSTEFFIYDIAINPDFQRRGLGIRLVENLKEICTARNISGIFVDAHREDEHALRFYESLGGRPDDVVQFTF